MPAAVQDAFYPLSSGHAEISLRRYASVETRANVTRMEKGEKNQKPFPIVVILPVSVQRRGGPSIFSIPPRATNCLPVLFFFLFLFRKLTACLNKHRAIDIIVIIVAEGMANAMPLRCSPLH